MERCLIDTALNLCFCHQYQITKDYIGRTSDTISYPIDHCNEFVSMPVNDFIKIRNAFDEYYKALNKSKNKMDQVLALPNAEAVHTVVSKK